MRVSRKRYGDKIRSVSSFSLAIRKYVRNFTAKNADGTQKICLPHTVSTQCLKFTIHEKSNGDK